MSSHPHAPAHESAHNTHHAHSQGHEAAHGSFKSYMTGFILSVILTAIPFWLVMGDVLESRALTVGIIIIFGGIQMVVHMIYFLHMNTRSEGGWTMLAMIFTIIIVVIMLAGSMWVMHHLNTNMMPMSPEMMKNMP
ncbi:cytochrome o ubiquinol oxidase subunit IV [Rhizobium lemnae]|uniref:Cytochrome bo(3) ubiquinol oxidase subunit 4 n=1 Tax=Rhizobium lemnae TaxID=1214924 RepID=A0ABV8EEC8_9HYPH|nr:cytochrome o ubiquinol oxidase subunit IV [Rhizobium lemnae]MCJ8508880.1 cytochrome o ubiquinol oxidase subunit IV [Rhizobium lemnae]